MFTNPDQKMGRSSFSSPAFAQLVRRLRHTNARYDQIAHQFRCRISPTHHAKRRAYRAGLRIDICKALALPKEKVISQTPSVLDKSSSPASVHTTAEIDIENEGHGTGQEDAYMHGLPLRNLPDVVRKAHYRGRKRVTLRLSSLNLSLKVDCECDAPYQGPMPGAPRLTPRQLPEDESGVEEMALGSALSQSSFTGSSDVLLTPPYDVHTYSDLCITIPPRGVKRKLQDAEGDEDTAPSQQPKRVLMTRWNESQKQ